MKVPLRFQVTEFDCGTVSLLNVFSYLFERKEIPAELVKAIHEYTLDCYDDKGNLGQGGTSKEAVEMLTHWITRYANTHDFGVVAREVEGEEVSLDDICDCVSRGGCVFIRCWQEVEHYVIVTGADEEYVYIFDPYYLEEYEYDKDGEVEIIFDKPFTHNRKVLKRRLLSTGREDFALGPIERRVCVLFERK